MAETRIEIKFKGLDQIMRRAKPEILERPMVRFFERATITVENRAKRKVPVDTGRLRASLGHGVDRRRPVPRHGAVGTSVFYAPFMEFGTGLLADVGGGTGRAHFPPPSKLERWARRHGRNAFAVAKGIFERGGLKPRRFLRDAFEESRGDIGRLLGRAANEIEGAWHSRIR